MYILDELDKRILTRIQEEFPIHPRPYMVLGEEFGLEEEEIFEKIQNLKKVGIIRRTGAIFNSNKLNYHSILCAIMVRDEYLEDIIAKLGQSSQVSHNYLRDNKYNIWFTLTAENQNSINAFICDIKKEAGVMDFLELPVLKMYKIKAVFNLTNDEK